MSRNQALAHLRSQLFSGVVIAAVLGFGWFFDQLAARPDAPRPAASSFDAGTLVAADDRGDASGRTHEQLREVEKP